jgi:hypothetical protein
MDTKGPMAAAARRNRSDFDAWLGSGSSPALMFENMNRKSAEM